MATMTTIKPTRKQIYEARVLDIAVSFVCDGYRQVAYENYSPQLYMACVKCCIEDFAGITNGAIKHIDVNPVDVITLIPEIELKFGVYGDVYGTDEDEK